MKLAASLVTIGTLSLFGCMTTKSPMAMATLEPRSGSNVRGTVHFTQMRDGNVKVNVDLTGLPAGVHGFHLHENPDCSAADASSAGPHFNPTGAPHGAPGAGSHAGDWGNVIADDRGEVHTEVMTRSVSVTEGMSSVIGRSVVAHADPDDLTSQPAGNAGKRVACGAVTIMTGSMR